MTQQQFDELRRSAFAIAYRMLGSVSEAEDVVQEGFLRLHRAREGGERIGSPRASLAFLVLLESLSPEQRAAFLLHEVFDEPYDRIAEIVGTSAQNARQLATRSRRHVEELLAHDVVLHGDGGGKAPALARALHGRARVARANGGVCAASHPARRRHLPA